jgi:hypothetical protein
MENNLDWDSDDDSFVDIKDDDSVVDIKDFDAKGLDSSKIFRFHPYKDIVFVCLLPSRWWHIIFKAPRSMIWGVVLQTPWRHDTYDFRIYTLLGGRVV